MIYPYLDDIPKERTMTDAFKGYEHTDRVHDGAFYDMKNITTELYPVLSPRIRRGIEKTFTNFQGMI